MRLRIYATLMFLENDVVIVRKWFILANVGAMLADLLIIAVIVLMGVLQLLKSLSDALSRELSDKWD